MAPWFLSPTNPVCFLESQLKWTYTCTKEKSSVNEIYCKLLYTELSEFFTSSTVYRVLYKTDWLHVLVQYCTHITWSLHVFTYKETKIILTDKLFVFIKHEDKRLISRIQCTFKLSPFYTNISCYYIANE